MKTCTQKQTLITGASLMFAAILLGIFGAHLLKDQLAAAGKASTWTKAYSYQMLHAMALLWLSQSSINSKAISRFWTIGTLCFCGSLYSLCLGFYPTAIAVITPIGGLCFLIGWLCLLIKAIKS